ncbi:arfGAP with SH3 domain, ANK repeat and PH domain-containing protein-like [Ylistrum balloti]|uniref:arfGAP with SH3 domain, ANK repeat and PH domain-containing protein-like n=1 Tax=Ylistrum balloti TaxID=509963 RepID=UPI002905E495|nr:arfGAP with SH3 domain, ANK repeat and PH domain-containing protein-like [Ylistrum balloti]
MPEQITVSEFLSETWDDYKSPTTSAFTKRMSHCRNTVSTLEEKLDMDRSGLNKMKKSIKALYNSVKRHVDNEGTFAENLDNLGRGRVDQEVEINEAFFKFSTVTKELAGSMNELVTKLNSMLLYPLDAFLKGDLKGVKGDMKKPFDKAWKDYETKFAKIEKEKKQQAKEAHMHRVEVCGSEIAEEMEKERKVFQLQLCEYFLKVNEIKTKKGVDLLLHLVDYYRALTTFYQEGLKTINHFQSFIENLVIQLNQIKQQQNKERQQLIDLRDSLKETMTSYKEPTSSKPHTGYSLHQLQGNKAHGCVRDGYLLKKSEGRIKKVWQKRKCIITDGLMFISHSDESKDPVKLNLLTCQVKLVPDDTGKRCFDLVSSSNNRTYHFQADDDKNMEEWISVLNNAKEQVLMKAFQNNSNAPALNQSVRELTASIIDRVRRLPGNNVCCDCNAPEPEWLSTNLGVLICLECCGIHRQLGVHISRTQSLVIDELGTSQLLIARVVGNGYFNDILEAKLDPSTKPTVSSPMEERLNFIKSKYGEHKYAIITCTYKDDLKQDLKQAILTHDINALLQVYAEGLDLMADLPDCDNGETALHLAIEEEEGYPPHIVDFIIQNSSQDSLALKTLDGNTALHICALGNKSECMKLLLRTKPELANVENSDGKTALDIARENDFQLCADLLKAAIQGRKDVFEHVNIDWDLMSEEPYYPEHFDSDDELENTPERKQRSRPPSIITGMADPQGSQNDLAGNRGPGGGPGSLPYTYSKPKKFVNQPGGKLRNSVRGYSHSFHNNTGTTNGGGVQTAPPVSETHDAPPYVPPLPPRNKKQQTPLVGIGQGHNRNASEPFPPRPTHKRTPSDPPPRPAPPEFRAIGIGSARPTSYRPRTQSTNEEDKGPITPPVLPSRQPIPDKEVPPVPVPRQKKKVPIGLKCRALFDCEADNEDELTFTEGEIIIVLREEEEDWWEGEIEGNADRRGLFPKTFVEQLPDQG